MSDNIPEDPFEDETPPAGAAPDPNDDPFADTKLPAVSFKDAPVGTEVRFLVSRAAQMVQQRDYITNELKVWPDGNPRMAAVFRGEVNGAAMSLWCPKPSSLFNGIGEAQHATGGARIGSGDTIVVRLEAEKPTVKDGKTLNPQKIYKVTVERG